MYIGLIASDTNSSTVDDSILLPHDALGLKSLTELNFRCANYLPNDPASQGLVMRYRTLMKDDDLI